MDNRFNKLLLYLEKQKISTKNLVAIKSDASFRKYYRLGNNILAMDAAPEKGESVSKFSEISEILHSFNLSAPKICLLYTSPSPRDGDESRMPSSA